MADNMKIKAKVSGISFTLDRSRMSDMDVLESLYDMEEAYADFEDGQGDEKAMTLSVIPLSRALFGKKQWKRIKDELRAQDSEVPHCARCIEFTFEALNEASKKLNGESKN